MKKVYSANTYIDENVTTSREGRFLLIIIILLLLLALAGITFVLMAQEAQGEMLNNLTNQIEQQDNKIDNLKKQIESIETSQYTDSDFKSYMSF